MIRHTHTHTHVNSFLHSLKRGILFCVTPGCYMGWNLVIDFFFKFWNKIGGGY